MRHKPFWYQCSPEAMVCCFGWNVTHSSAYGCSVPTEFLSVYISLFSKIRWGLTYLPTYLRIWRHIWMLPKETSAICGVSFETAAIVQCYVGFKVCWPGCTGSGHLMPPVKQRPRSIILPLESPGSTVGHFSPYLWQSQQISFFEICKFSNFR